MRTLAFDRGERWGRRHLRTARFERRSFLPIGAVCVVANGVRESIAALLGRAATVRVLEPVIPSDRAWTAIAEGALLYRARGSAAEAAVILRAGDAGALAAAAFGETRAAGDSPRALSRIERDVVDRIAAAIAATLASVCGPLEAGTEPIAAIAGFVTYFEVSIVSPVEARIGIALSRDPVPEPRGRMEIADLRGLALDAAATIDLECIAIAAVAALSPGAVIGLPAGPVHASLRIAGVALARGTCGARNGRYAIAISGRA